MLALDEALEKLAAHDPPQAKLVELRYFCGLTGDQAAAILGISPTTADRYWAYARAARCHYPRGVLPGTIRSYRRPVQEIRRRDELQETNGFRPCRLSRRFIFHRRRGARLADEPLPGRAAHKQRLVHRDIKPANILLENGVERVKITDFGLARSIDDASLTQSGVVAGTPLYMSPEQAEGLPVDHRSDLFSLGTVLYAMCTGHSPFRASGTHAVLKRVIDASACTPLQPPPSQTPYYALKFPFIHFRPCCPPTRPAPVRGTHLGKGSMSPYG